MQIVEPGARQQPRNRQAGDHARAAPDASTRSAAGRGVRMVNSLKKFSFKISTPATADSLSASWTALAWLTRASRRSPVSAEQRHMDREGERAQAGIGADVAGRLLAADMLLARRERQHEAAPSVGVDRLAARRPGIWRTILHTRREQPDIGAAEIERVADDWPSPTTMSAPIAPGERNGAERRPPR